MCKNKLYVFSLQKYCVKSHNGASKSDLCLDWSAYSNVFQVVNNQIASTFVEYNPFLNWVMQ